MAPSSAPLHTASRRVVPRVSAVFFLPFLVGLAARAPGWTLFVLVTVRGVSSAGVRSASRTGGPGGCSNPCTPACTSQFGSCGYWVACWGGYCIACCGGCCGAASAKGFACWSGASGGKGCPCAGWAGTCAGNWAGIWAGI